jgi:hypothetical protein
MSRIEVESKEPLRSWHLQELQQLQIANIANIANGLANRAAPIPSTADLRLGAEDF